MLIAKGYEVAFRLAGGRVVRAPKTFGLLHDPSGGDWSRCSGLVVGFTRRGARVKNARLARQYFGYEPKAGDLRLPPRALTYWKRVGEVDEIRYWRPGEHEGDFEHGFHKGWLAAKKLPLLYRHGRALRIELGAGCEWNWRGIVTP